MRWDVLRRDVKVAPVLETCKLLVIVAENALWVPFADVIESTTASIWSHSASDQAFSTASSCRRAVLFLRCLRECGQLGNAAKQGHLRRRWATVVVSLGRDSRGALVTKLTGSQVFHRSKSIARKPLGSGSFWVSFWARLTLYSCSLL